MPGGASEAPLRDRITEDVRSHPGASAREVQRRLGLAWGETAYHLDRLAKGGEVRRERGGWRDYYFPKDLTFADRRTLQALQSPAERLLTLAVLEHPGAGFTELVERAGLGRSTTSFHLRRLVELGVLRPSTESGTRGFHAAEPERIRSLVTAYRENWADALVDRFVGAFAGLLKE